MDILALCGFLTMMVPVGPPVTWTFSTIPNGGAAVEVQLQAQAEEGWHIYATQLENDLGPIATTIRFEPDQSYSLEGALMEPDPEEVYDKNFMMQVRYHSGTVPFKQRVVLNTDQGTIIKGDVEFMVCNDKTCLPPEIVTFAIEVPVNSVKP